MIKATGHSQPGWYPPPTVFRCTQCDSFILLDGVSIANVHCHKCGGDEFCSYYDKALVEEREKAHIKNLKAHIENLKAHELFEKSHVERYDRLELAHHVVDTAVETAVKRAADSIGRRLFLLALGGGQPSGKRVLVTLMDGTTVEFRESLQANVATIKHSLSTRAGLQPEHVTLHMISRSPSGLACATCENDEFGLSDYLTVSELLLMSTADCGLERDELHFFAVISLIPRELSTDSVHVKYKCPLNSQEQNILSQFEKKVCIDQMRQLLSGMNAILKVGSLKDGSVGDDYSIQEVLGYAFASAGEDELLCEQQWFHNDFPQNLYMRHFVGIYKVLFKYARYQSI